MVQPGTEIEVGSQASLFAADNKETVLTEEFVTETICKDLEREGYSVQPVVIPACAIGAPHRRDRVFFIARNDAANTDSGTDYRESRKDEKESGKEWVQERDEIRKSFKSGYVRPKVFSIASCTNGNDAWRPRHGEIGCSEGEGEEVQREWKWIRCDVERAGSKTAFANTKGAGIERKCERKQKQRKLNRRDSRKVPTSFKDFPTQPPICSGDDGISLRLDGITFPKWRQESVKGFGNAIVPQVMYELFKAIEEIETKYFKNQ